MWADTIRLDSVPRPVCFTPRVMRIWWAWTVSIWRTFKHQLRGCGVRVAPGTPRSVFAPRVVDDFGGEGWNPVIRRCGSLLRGVSRPSLGAAPSELLCFMLYDGSSLYTSAVTLVFVLAWLACVMRGRFRYAAILHGTPQTRQATPRREDASSREHVTTMSPRESPGAHRGMTSSKKGTEQAAPTTGTGSPDGKV